MGTEASAPLSDGSRSGPQLPALECGFGAPESLMVTCEGGVAAEIANAATYDRLSRTVKDPAALLIFARLRAASAFNHLPALRACLARAGSGAGSGPAPHPAASPASGASPLVGAIGLAAAAVLVRALRRKTG